ncbi:oxidoreductase, partial [Hymenopellis radicata]
MLQDTDSAIPKIQWKDFVPSLYKTRKPPQPLGTVLISDLERKAKEKLKDHPDCFEYARGNAGSESTFDANIKAFQRYRIIPRMMVDTTHRNLEATILGVRYPTPLVIGPIGTQALFTEEGELAPARAGRVLGVPFVLSSVASRSIEDVAEANGNGHRFFQLYWPKSDDITLSLLKRAKDNGYSALVVTLDNFSIGWRTHDINATFAPPLHGYGNEVGRSDPVFMAKLGLKPVTNHRPSFPYEYKKLDALLQQGDAHQAHEAKVGMGWVAEVCSGHYRSWDALRLLRDNWTGPIVLKGILKASDAEKALEYGIDGIVVSNHGGRQVDGAIPSLYALVDIMQSPKVVAAQKAGTLSVLLDSGVRTGSDIIKALALGAQGVFLGRAYLWGSIIAGQEGVEQVLRQTMADLDVTLGLIGYQSLDDVRAMGGEVVKKI